MKRYINYLIAISGISVLLLFSSCLKNGPFYTDFSNVAPSINMPLAAFYSNSPFALTFTPADTPSHFYVYVNVASPKKLGRSINATLALDTAYLSQYNATQFANDSTFVPYEVLPDSDYSLSTMNLTVPANQRQANAVVSIFTNKVDASHNYVLPLTIVKADLPIENWNHLMINVIVKNQYDGVYSLTGYASQPSNAALTGPFGPLNEDLVTSSGNSVTMSQQPWSTTSNSALPGTYNPDFAIDPSTNKVTVTNQQFGSLVLNTPGYNSHYDPSTKTIYAGWQYTGGSGVRMFVDTLVYLHPR